MFHPKTGNHENKIQHISERINSISRISFDSRNHTYLILVVLDLNFKIMGINYFYWLLLLLIFKIKLIYSCGFKFKI
jgi:hypothetical protein